jgi:hypothetical protein
MEAAPKTALTLLHPRWLPHVRVGRRAVTQVDSRCPAGVPRLPSCPAGCAGGDGAGPGAICPGARAAVASVPPACPDRCLAPLKLSMREIKTSTVSVPASAGQTRPQLEQQQRLY